MIYPAQRVSKLDTFIVRPLCWLAENGAEGVMIVSDRNQTAFRTVVKVINGKTLVVWSDLAWSDLAWLDLVWSGLACSGLVWSGLLRCVCTLKPIGFLRNSFLHGKWRSNGRLLPSAVSVQQWVCICNKLTSRPVRYVK
jgi:hypothetical protein